MSTFEKPQSPIYSKSNDAYIYPLTTIDQVIMEDGSRLNTKLEDIKTGMTMELLWENPSPTSKFETKTLDVNLNDYQYFMVEYYAADNEKQIYSACGRVGGYCKLRYESISAAVVEAIRIVNSTVNGVTFSTCWKWQRTSSGEFSTAENDFLLLPVRIYGIKGVFA